MFNHQYDFDIEIPKEVITDKKHDKIFKELLETKSIIGLCGYSKSGKDTIAKRFIDDYGFHRVAFADNIKIEMNKYLKEDVYNYLANIPSRDILDTSVHPDVSNALLLEDMRTLTMDDMDFLTEDIPVKKRLRPFIIWYGEKLREINGPYYWINQAFKIDANGHDKIILSDVRRIKELDVFKWSNQFHKKSMESFAKIGTLNRMPDLLKNKKSYSTLLFHVNQFQLTDKDALTHECIRVSQENWMFDYTFYIDPRLRMRRGVKNNGDRKKAVDVQVKEVADKFGISKLDKTIAHGRQTSIYDEL